MKWWLKEEGVLISQVPGQSMWNAEGIKSSLLIPQIKAWDIFIVPP